jgi:hypothetical protein
MASAAQVLANKENAKRPRTLSEETKESLRTRALKHGLATKLDANTVLISENKQEFETIRNALLAGATLGAPEEILLINLQAQGYWKLQRALKMETGALDSSLIAVEIQEKISKNLKDDTGLGSALAFALREQTAWFETLRRYSTTAERTFFKATRELAMIRKAGPQEPIGQSEINPPEISQPEIGQPEIGYVPQNAQPEETTAESTEEIKAPTPEIQHPGARPRPELGGLTAFAFRDKLETMSEAEAFEYLDKLTAPPKARD